VVGVDVTDPTKVTSWATPARGGGIWAAPGIASDGSSLYFATGNTFDATTWGGGEGVMRLAAGPTFSNSATDYFAPTNWPALDGADLDMGTSLLVDVPGATPSALVLGFGKDGNVYAADRANLGGVGSPLAVLGAATGEINAAATTFTTTNGVFVAMRLDSGGGVKCPNGGSGNLVAVKVGAAAPPTLSPAWCGNESDLASPASSVSNAAGADPIVWTLGANRLYAYDGETGTELFAGGATGDRLSAVQHFQTPIVAKGRVYVAAENQLYAFTP
jgi:hypothetical protein